MRPTTIPEYIAAAPDVAQPHLKKLYKLLQRAAPEAREVIKWGQPFFVEPRFVFAFSAHKAHVNFAPTEGGLAAFREELAAYKTTKNYLQLPYTEPLPEELIRKIAERRLHMVRMREDDAFF